MLFKISLVICTINLRRFVLTRKVQALKKTISIFLDSTVWLHRWTNFVSRNVRHEIILVMDRFKEQGLADHVTSNRMFSSIILLTDRLVSDDLIVCYRDEVLDRYYVGWDVISVKILHGLFIQLFSDLLIRSWRRRLAWRYGWIWIYGWSFSWLMLIGFMGGVQKTTYVKIHLIKFN